LNIHSDAIIANQCGQEGSSSFSHEGHTILEIRSKDRGVAKNRNLLLGHAPEEGISLCIDDDCPLCDDAESIVEAFFEEHRCDVALFNGRVPYEGNRLVHSMPTAKVKRFRDVSYAGGPGLAFIGGKLRATGLRYDERLGYPNYIYAGEDSFFLKNLVSKDLNFYRSDAVLFTVAIDKTDNSTYFHGVDDQFVFTRGAVGYLLYPNSPLFYPLHQLFVLMRRFHVNPFKILPVFLRGRREGKGLAKKREK
jgi:hypothetical protein